MLPPKWAAEVDKLARRAQAKQKRKNKTNPTNREPYSLGDGRTWHDGLKVEVLLLFQLLMAEEAKHHPVARFQDVQQYSDKYGSSAGVPCAMDRKVMCALDILQHCSSLAHEQISSPPTSPMGGLADMNMFCSVMSPEDALKERCVLFLVDVASAHPALFLRYQREIYQRIATSTLSLVRLQNKEHQHLRQMRDDYSFLASGGATGTEERDISEVPGLMAEGSKKGGSWVGSVRFTASGVDIQPCIWEVLFSCYEAMNPLLPYLHASTQEFGMEHCLNFITEVADRRLVSACMPPSLHGCILELIT